MQQNDIDYTRTWWAAVCKNPPRLHAWLTKLYATEYGGYEDHAEFVNKNASAMSARQIQILDNIGQDEKEHAAFLDHLLDDWGVVRQTPPASAYWDIVLEGAVDYQGYCAANYYGESTACDRFGILHDMDCTPKDVKLFIDFALPDEIFHRTTLKREAGEEALALYALRHKAAMDAIMKGRTQ